jgi:hypothetical protein
VTRRSAVNLVQWILLLGGPGLLLGGAIGALIPRWKVLVALAAIGTIALWYGIKHAPDGADDDDPAVLVAMAMVTNFGGWLVGLAVGAATTRVRRSD